MDSPPYKILCILMYNFTIVPGCQLKYSSLLLVFIFTVAGGNNIYIFISSMREFFWMLAVINNMCDTVSST